MTLLQERDGWLSKAELKALAKRLNLPLHRLESVSTFYTHFRRTPPKRVEVAVCRDLSGAMARGGGAAERRRAAAGPAHRAGTRGSLRATPVGSCAVARSERSHG